MMNQQSRVNLENRVGAWRDAFTDKSTGIINALDGMIWNYAVFCNTVSIVRLASQRDRNSAPINQPLFNLVAEGYWAILLVGTRRLIDKGPISGPKGVYSLRAVLEDVRRCQPEITRRFYVEVIRSCRYDLEAMRREQWERLKAAKGVVWGDNSLMLSELSHKHFDYLSETSEGDGADADRISMAILDRMEIRLSKLDRIADHVSSHMVHAGNSQSRTGKELTEFDIREARLVLMELKGLADLMGVWFANQGGSGLATYIGDQFEGLEKPLVETEDLTALADNWRQVERDVSAWSINPIEL